MLSRYCTTMVPCSMFMPQAKAMSNRLEARVQ